MNGTYVFKCPRRNKRNRIYVLARLLSINIKCDSHTHTHHLKEVGGRIYSEPTRSCSNTTCQHYTNIIQRTSDKKKLCKFVINFYSHITETKTPCRLFARNFSPCARSFRRTKPYHCQNKIATIFLNRANKRNHKTIREETR